MNMIRFKVGSTYTARLISDSQATIKVKILARTAKQVTIQEDGEKPCRKGIEIYEGVETCYPCGKYSMAPCIRASHEVEKEDSHHTVRIDTLRKGALFDDSNGTRWMYIRQDGASKGVYHCERQSDGVKSTFAGCAEVIVQSKPEIFFEGIEERLN